MNPISTSNAEHYVWGNDCDGWHLLKRHDLSVIQERVTPGRAEVMHYHEHARQFFYILEGEGQISFKDEVVTLCKGDGLEIPLQMAHRFENKSNADAFSLLFPCQRVMGTG